MKTLSLPILSLLTTVSLLCFPKNNFAQAPDLRSIVNFSLFTTTGAVSNTGVSEIAGKIGTNNGAITGFTYVPGQEENANTVTAEASTDLQLIYDELFTASPTFPPHDPVFGGGETLTPGVYLVESAGSLEGILFLDAQGDPNAVFIFQIHGAFSPGPSSKISLIGSAMASNVFWAVEGGGISIATSSDMKGNFIANPGAATMAASSILEGRLLCTTGAIAVDGVLINMPVSMVLPVTLIDFRAIRNNDFIKLNWTTANEFLLERYELERSATGNNFYTIGSVNCNNTPFAQTYNWLDNAPLAGINVYRLKIINMDRGYTYSPVIKLDMNARKGISVYPNPATDHMLLQMYGQLKGEHIMTLYNSNGKKVMSNGIILDGNDAVRSFALDKNLSTGIYYMEIYDPAKNKTALRIFIDQKGH